MQRVATHVHTSDKKPGNACATIPLDFVERDKAKSMAMFMERLPDLRPGGGHFQLCQIGGYFLLVRGSAELCDNNDWSGATLPDPFGMCYNPEAERAANSRPKCWLITQVVKDAQVKVFFQVGQVNFLGFCLGLIYCLISRSYYSF